MRELCSPVFDMLSPEAQGEGCAHSVALWTSTGPAQRSTWYRWVRAWFWFCLWPVVSRRAQGDARLRGHHIRAASRICIKRKEFG